MVKCRGFAKGQKVVVKEQISESVWGGDKGTVLGIRRNKKQAGIRYNPCDVKVKLNMEDIPYFIDPKLLKKL
jgi:hypothetical protein